MASVKDLRSKELSKMSYEELTSYIDEAERAGYKRSESKDLGKAEDLRKLLRPDNYGSETVDSAKNKLMSSTTLETKQRLGLAPTNTSQGLSRLSGGATSAPDLNQLYNNAMNDPALKALEEELAQKEKARDAEVAKINDNPYYAEARRVGKIDKLEQKAGAEINTLAGRIAEKKADAQVKVNIATQQYNIDSAEYQRNLNQLNLLISSGAILGASSSDIAQIALASGMSTDMVKGIIDSTRSAQQQLQLATDDSGNVTIFDARTGEIVNTIPGIGGSKSSSSGGSAQELARQKAFESSIETGISQLKEGENWGVVWDRIRTMYPEVPNELIDNLLGVEWRKEGAYEDYKYKQD